LFRQRQLSGSLDFKTTFNNGDIIREGNNFDEILVSMSLNFFAVITDGEDKQ
jgi:hypothetical protein